MCLSWVGLLGNIFQVNDSPVSEEAVFLYSICMLHHVCQIVCNGKYIIGLWHTVSTIIEHTKVIKQYTYRLD